MPPKKKKEEEYLVEKLVEMKMEKGKKVFLVKWKGYSAKQNTWEPVANLKGFEEEMKAFDAPAPKESKKRKAPEPAPAPAPKKAAAAAPAAKAKRAAPEPKAAPPAKKAKAAPAPKAKAAPAPKAKAPAKKPAKLDVGKLASALKALITGKKAEKPPKEKKAPKEKAPPKKKEKAAKPAKKTKVTTVVAVDKILAMKANAKGGLLYQILWQDGTKSWEPEDNIMDDDLVDDFEAAEQARAYSTDEIGVGSEVEVKNLIDGFENSWSAAKVTKKEKGNKFTVEFTGFVNEKGASLTEGGVTRDRLRVDPGDAPKGWVPIAGEILEMNEDDCWWEARVIEVSGKKAKLQLRVSDEFKTGTVGSKKLRPCSWLNLKSK